MTVTILFIATFAAFIVLDAIWLFTVGGRLFKSALGDLMRKPPGLVPAGLLYVILAAAVVHFAGLPALRGEDLTVALANGAVLGLAAYAAYDLTNLATLRRYTVTLAVVDIAWGTAVTAASAVIGVAVARALV